MTNQVDTVNDYAGFGDQLARRWFKSNLGRADDIPKGQNIYLRLPGYFYNKWHTLFKIAVNVLRHNYSFHIE